MSLTEQLQARSWRAELILDMPTGRKSYGRWNRGEVTAGSEAQTVDDPEFGAGLPVGGKQTAESITISRPYRISRDRPVYQELKPVRGRVGGDLLVWELDPHGQPYSSSPLDRLVVVFAQIVLPEGDIGSSDNSVISCELQVRA